MFGLDGLERALRSLGAVLEARGLTSAILVAGGSSLLMLGLIDRLTADVDVLGLVDGDRYVKATNLPPGLAEAASDVAAALDLPRTWLNTGPSSLFDFGLPIGFERRAEVRQFAALEVHVVVLQQLGMEVRDADGV